MPSSNTMMIVICVIASVVCLGVGILAGIKFRVGKIKTTLLEADEEAKQILNDAIKSAETKKRETLFEAKEEIHKERTAYEQEVKERRAELSKQERRLQQKEENLDRKNDTLDKRNETLRKRSQMPRLPRLRSRN